MRVDVGIIGGTGIGDRLLAMPGRPVHVPTCRGLARGRLIQAGDRRIFVMSRHSAGHKVPPHKVNYAAMALGLKQLGARVCLSTAAVGSLRRDWVPGTLVACRDFYDVSGRFATLFNRNVSHTDFTHPFPARKLLLEGAGNVGIDVQDAGVYLCGNGPRYETPFEIEVYANLGGDLVGMTAASEAIVMREAGIDYGCLAIVTNLAAGMSDEFLAHGDVEREMRKSGEMAVQVLMAAVALA